MPLDHPKIAVALRLAEPADADDLVRLAQLDSRALPRGPHLVAVRDGKIDAAISLPTREVVANPFVPTAELCELLRLHASAVPRAKARSTHTRRLHPRPLGATA